MWRFATGRLAPSLHGTGRLSSRLIDVPPSRSALETRSLTESTEKIGSDVREAPAAVRRAISELERRSVFRELSGYEQGSLNILREVSPRLHQVGQLTREREFSA